MSIVWYSVQLPSYTLTSVPAGAPELLYPIPVEAPATTRRAVRLVDFLRPDLQKISLPPGVPTLPAFAAAKAAEMEQRDLTEHDGAGVPDLTPL